MGFYPKKGKRPTTEKSKRIKMAHNCAKCRFRAKYDNKPDSIIGRLWRWHINWCPGWKGYLRSLPPGKKDRIAQTYGIGKRPI